MARPRRRKSSSDNREDDIAIKRRRLSLCTGSFGALDNNTSEQVSSSIVVVSPHSSQGGSVVTAVTESPSCSMRSDIHKGGTQHLRDQINVNKKENADDDSIAKEEEEPEDDLIFPRFLLAGLQSDNADLAIQAVHDIAVRVQQMEDPVLQDNATWVLESLYSTMDDDNAFELLKQEVHVLVIVAAALSTYSSNNDEEKINNGNDGYIDNGKDNNSIENYNDLAHYADNRNHELPTIPTTAVTAKVTACPLLQSHSIGNQALTKYYPAETHLVTDGKVNSNGSTAQTL